MKAILFRIANIKEFEEICGQAERLTNELVVTVKAMKDFQFELVAQTVNESNLENGLFLSLAEMEALNKLRYPELFNGQT